MNFEATNKSAVIAGVWAGVCLVVIGFYEDQLFSGNLSAFVTCVVVLLPIRFMVFGNAMFGNAKALTPAAAGVREEQKNFVEAIRRMGICFLVTATVGAAVSLVQFALAPKV